ncbi:MAG: 3D domain-containing protein [Bacillota bacterium]
MKPARVSEEPGQRRRAVLWGVAIFCVVVASCVMLDLKSRQVMAATAAATAVAEGAVAFVPRTSYINKVFHSIGMNLEAAPTGPSRASSGWVVERSIVKRRVPLPAPTQRVNDPTLDKGQVRVLKQGADGAKEQMVLITRDQAGNRTETVMREWVSVEPKPTIMAVGSREPLRVLVTSRGTFTYRKVLDMVATAYEPGPVSCGEHADGYTAIGLKAEPGIVAVDPRVIPLRTKLYVEGYGPAIAGDVGGAIKGNRIDLLFRTVEECIQYGRRRVKVYILED